MKKVFLLLFVFFSLTTISFSGAGTSGELNFRILNGTSSQVSIEMELVSTLCWDKNHNLTSLFEGGTQSETNPSTSTLIEFLFCSETWSEYYDITYGLGLYRFTVSVNDVEKDNFLIDVRTSDLPDHFVSDINLDFNVTTGKIYYQNTSTEFPFITSYWSLFPEDITNNKNGLEPLTPDNFQVSSSGNPQLSWNHSSITEDNVSGYAVYRSVISQTDPPPGVFTKLTTVGSTTTSYTDYDYLIGGNLIAYYKIAAVNTPKESEYTSIINRGVGAYKKGSENIQYTFSLLQNFPNPFNPKTIINFSLPATQYVSLTLYNTAGEQISILIDDIIEEGNHSIEINGTNLSSGIYLYRMEAGSFIKTRKLILLK